MEKDCELGDKKFDVFSFQVNTYTKGGQIQSRIAAHASGFNIVWYGNPPGDVRLQRIDAGTGLPVTNLFVTDDDGRESRRSSPTASSREICRLGRRSCLELELFHAG